MELSDIAKKEIKIHMDQELGRNNITVIGKKEIKIHMDQELGRDYQAKSPDYARHG